MLHLLLVGGLITGLALQPTPTPAPAEPPAVETPPAANELSPAPPFTLAEPDGTTHSLESLRGQVVLMMFWVSWADNCLHMADAHLLRIYRSLHDAGKPFRVVLIGGAHDDNAMRQQNLATQHGWPFLLLEDPDHSVTRAYGAQNWGWLALIDESGNLIQTGDSHDSLGTMESWLSRHFGVTVATAGHGNSNDASVVMISIVVVLGLLVLATTRKRQPVSPLVPPAS